MDQAFNIRPDILNLIEENVGNRLGPTGAGKDFLDKTPIAQALSTINKWDLIKLKNFCTAKIITIRGKWKPTEWEKIFTSHTTDRGLISSIYKE